MTGVRDAKPQLDAELYFQGRKITKKPSMYVRMCFAHVLMVPNVERWFLAKHRRQRSACEMHQKQQRMPNVEIQTPRMQTEMHTSAKCMHVIQSCKCYRKILLKIVLPATQILISFAEDAICHSCSYSFARFCAFIPVEMKKKTNRQEIIIHRLLVSLLHYSTRSVLPAPEHAKLE